MLLHSNSYAFASGKLFYHRFFALTAAYTNHTSLIIKPLQGNAIYIPFLHDNSRICGRQSVSWKIIQPFPISGLAATGLARHCKTLGVEGNKQSKLFLFEKKIR